MQTRSKKRMLDGRFIKSTIENPNVISTICKQLVLTSSEEGGGGGPLIYIDELVQLLFLSKDERYNEALRPFVDVCKFTSCMYTKLNTIYSSETCRVIDLYDTVVFHVPTLIYHKPMLQDLINMLQVKLDDFLKETNDDTLITKLTFYKETLINVNGLHVT
jgi:hypothetical protein